MSDVLDLDVCARCKGTGMLSQERCSSRCGIRHAVDCPVTVHVPCPSCELRQLGDDLQWSAGGGA